MSLVQIFLPCLLLSSSTRYQTFKHGFQISKHVRACRHVKIGPDLKPMTCIGQQIKTHQCDDFGVHWSTGCIVSGTASLETAPARPHSSRPTVIETGTPSDRSETKTNHNRKLPAGNSLRNARKKPSVCTKKHLPHSFTNRTHARKNSSYIGTKVYFSCLGRSGVHSVYNSLTFKHYNCLRL